MTHHAIGIPTLTSADRILEATRQLDRALKQLPKDGPTDKVKAIKLLREILLGEKDKPLPPNSINKEKSRQKELEQLPLIKSPTETTPVEASTPSPKHIPSPNYISEDEDDSHSEPEEDWDFSQASPVSGDGLRRSKRVLTQLRRNEKDGLLK